MTVNTYSRLSLLHCVLTVYIHINSLVIIDTDVYVTMNNRGRETVCIPDEDWQSLAETLPNIVRSSVTGYSHMVKPKLFW